ncbi:hypothetical protein ILYODFUR_033173 [Ilyodon furcidens]|uniref:Secreted protein n=1 Tax=Ilyodon furcidens TaxID=33524 RepID=A0ABV0TQ05_9TELE
MIQLLMFFLLLYSAPAFLECYSLFSCVVTVHSSRFVMCPDEIIYLPCSFAQGASDCVFTHSKPFRFSLCFSLMNLGLHKLIFYENRQSPLRSGLHWSLRAEEKTSSLGTVCPVSPFMLRPG